MLTKNVKKGKKRTHSSMSLTFRMSESETTEETNLFHLLLLLYSKASQHLNTVY